MCIDYIFKTISDIILLTSITIFIYAFGISKIQTSFRYCLSILTTFIFSTSMFILYENNFEILPLILYPLMFIISFKIIFGKITITQIYVSIVIDFSITLLSSCIASFITQINLLPYSKAETISLLCIRFLSLVLGFVLSNNARYKQIYSISKSIPQYVFTLVLITLICIETLAIFNNYPQNNKIKEYAFSILIILLTITLIIMIFSLLINVASKNYYTALNSLLEKQVEAQIAHYEKLEELNRDIRQLRHDYINHLTSVSTLIEHKNYPDALQYIERLTESTHCNETIFSTGNHLADAILTGKSSECKEFADIEFNGIITDRINNIDMCAILANALDNAIEACRKCSGRSKISIAAQNKQGYWVMTMRNPTIGEDSEGLMKTSKEDTQNHGFGLLSIEQAVKRYDGNIKVGIKDGIFEISIVVRD